MTDLSKFSADERPGEFVANFTVTGTVRMTIKANSVDEAREKAKDMMQDDQFGVSLDAVEDVDVSHVYKSHTMYRVLRNGSPMQTSRVLETDIPREPDERGF